MTMLIRILCCTSGSVVEYRLAKARVAGSNPVSRFFYWLELLDFSRVPAFCISGKNDRSPDKKTRQLLRFEKEECFALGEREKFSSD